MSLPKPDISRALSVAITKKRLPEVLHQLCWGPVLHAELVDVHRGDIQPSSSEQIASIPDLQVSMIQAQLGEGGSANMKKHHASN